MDDVVFETCLLVRLRGRCASTGGGLVAVGSSSDGSLISISTSSLSRAGVSCAGATGFFDRLVERPPSSSSGNTERD